MNHRLAPFTIGMLVFTFALAAAAQSTPLQATPAQPVARIAPPPENATVQELLERAETLHAQKAYLDAVDYYRAAIKKENSAVTWNKMGITQLQMGKYDEAKKSFEKSIKLDKTYPDAHNNLGVIWYMRKKYGKAIKNYKKAIELRETAASFHSNLGTAYFSKKELNRAVTEYQRALTLDPNVLDHTSTAGVAAQLSSPEDRAHYSYILAKMYAQTGNFDRSLNYLRKAMEDGYPAIGEVYKEKEFAELRKDPRFNDLMISKPVAIPQ
jgi:tetratricopeptide (TPR) repeat protein